MTLPAVFPLQLDAPLARIDPRWKLAALVPAAIAVSVLRTPGPAAVALAGSWLLLGMARLPLRWYLGRLATIVVFLGFFLLLLPLSDHGDDGERWQWGPLSISPTGTVLAAVLLCKALAVVSLLLAAMSTAPVETHLQALHALRVPGALVHLTALTIRYLAVLLEEFQRMRIALRLRGFRQSASPRSLQVVAHVSGMLLVRGHERAERVAQALRCRGFDGQFRTLTAFHTRPADVCFFTMILTTTIGLVVWDQPLGILPWTR